MDEIAEAADLRPLGPDDLAEVRYIHAAAFRLLARPPPSAEQVAAFTAHVYGQSYTRALSEAASSESLLGAWLGSELIGTAGWSPGDGLGTVARIRWVFVRPLFTQLGVGTRLVQEAERRARSAGFRAFAAEAVLDAVHFFSRLGYEVSSHGMRALARVEGVPVAFMRKSADPAEAAGSKAWH